MSNGMYTTPSGLIVPAYGRVTNNRMFCPRFNRVFGGFAPTYDNVVDAFDPELWAREAMSILTESMIMSQLVYRDYEPLIQAYGDTVNIGKPGNFKAKRKHTSDNVVIQDATSTKIQVQLNQHIHVSFLIRDGEESRSFLDLVQEYLKPALIAESRFLDVALLCQYPAFLNHSVGSLGNLTNTNSKNNILALRQKLNELNIPLENRYMMLTPGSETAILNNDLFLAAYAVGDDGSALRNATLGMKLGIVMIMANNAANVAAGSTSLGGLVNHAGGYGAGTTVIAVDTFVGAVGVGEWLMMTDGQPHQVVAHTETTGNTTSITIDPPLNAAIADNDAITGFTPGAINNAGGYPAGWAKEISVDGFTVAPRQGQMVTFGTASGGSRYGIIDVNGIIGITLDRPLDFAVADNDTVNLGPPGAYNLAFTTTAIALVVRPLAMPRPNTGADAAVQEYNGLAIRVVITYDGERQGHLVTVDMLAGIKVLDPDRGAVLLG